MDLYIGIDIGFQGAISFAEKKDDKLINTRVFKMPIIVDDKNKKQYDIKNVVKLFKDNIKCDYKNVICVAEKVHAFAGQGISSTARLCEGSGIIQGIIGALELQLERVNPMNWKKEAFPELLVDGKIVKALPKNERSKMKAKLKAQAKDKAREIATNLHPELSDCFKKKNQDGLSESILMLHWLFKKYP